MFWKVFWYSLAFALCVIMALAYIEGSDSAEPTGKPAQGKAAPSRSQQPNQVGSKFNL